MKTIFIEREKHDRDEEEELEKKTPFVVYRKHANHGWCKEYLLEATEESRRAPVDYLCPGWLSGTAQQQDAAHARAKWIQEYAPSLGEVLKKERLAELARKQKLEEERVVTICLATVVADRLLMVADLPVIRVPDAQVDVAAILTAAFCMPPQAPEQISRPLPGFFGLQMSQPTLTAECPSILTSLVQARAKAEYGYETYGLPVEIVLLDQPLACQESLRKSYWPNMVECGIADNGTVVFRERGVLDQRLWQFHKGPGAKYFQWIPLPKSTIEGSENALHYSTAGRTVVVLGSPAARQSVLTIFGVTWSSVYGLDWYQALNVSTLGTLTYQKIHEDDMKREADGFLHVSIGSYLRRVMRNSHVRELLSYAQEAQVLALPEGRYYSSWADWYIRGFDDPYNHHAFYASADHYENSIYASMALRRILPHDVIPFIDRYLFQSTIDLPPAWDTLVYAPLFSNAYVMSNFSCVAPLHFVAWQTGGDFHVPKCKAMHLRHCWVVSEVPFKYASISTRRSTVEDWEVYPLVRMTGVDDVYLYYVPVEWQYGKFFFQTASDLDFGLVVPVGMQVREGERDELLYWDTCPFPDPQTMSGE